MNAPQWNFKAMLCQTLSEQMNGTKHASININQETLNFNNDNFYNIIKYLKKIID